MRPWHEEQRHRRQNFSDSDRLFEETLVDVDGPYLNPPERAMVLSCNEKRQIQSLDRTQKSLRISPDRLKTLTYDDKRHGTTTLFAAIKLAEGKIIAERMPQHRPIMNGSSSSKRSCPAEFGNSICETAYDAETWQSKLL